MSPADGWATATGNKHKKFGEDRTRSFGDMLADRQTDKHTHSSSQYSTTPTREKSGVSDPHLAWK